MSDDELEDLDDIDRDALERALQLTLKEPDRTEQVSEMLAERGWFSAASFSAYHRQCTSLRLKPWEYPPCWADDEIANDPLRASALTLLRRMEGLDLSRYEPDPIAAIAAASAKAKKAT
jgi:hypothetical protein